MGNVWQEQEAKARFSEMLEKSISEGPQIVAKGSVATAVLVPMEQWRRLERLAKSDLKALLLAPESRTDALTLPRKEFHGRAPVSLE